ncbi:MAG: hypothetical protein ACTHMV_16785 [Chitinophagaceae bacterium]
MKKGYTIYQFKQQLISILMLVTLLWLTVSTPFVYESQSQLAKQQALLSQSSHHDANDDEQTCTPLGSNTTEEKTHGSINSLSEEYLHLDSELFHLAELSLNHTRYHTASEYVAFHGELLCPPPNYRG